MATPIVVKNETNVASLNVQGAFEYIYEDEQCVVFNDQNPLATVHFVVVPKKIIPSVSKATEEEEKKILVVFCCELSYGKGLKIQGQCPATCVVADSIRGIKKTRTAISVFTSHLMVVARNMALQNGLDKTGYHVMIDENYNSPIPRLMSMHVFGRALHHMMWPVGPGCKL